MAEDLIRYDVLVQDALRGVVRKVITEAAKVGLPGEHHFFVAFDTNSPGVRISSRLKEKYPEEMTVVLQHQYWELTVNDNNFEVGLSFDGIAEKLIVPFSAIKGFFDPSVQFGLQFEPAEAEGQTTGQTPKQGPNQGSGQPTPMEVVPLDKASNSDDSAVPEGETPTEPAPEEDGEPATESDSGDADAGEADSGKADSGKADSGEADSGEADSGEASADVVSLDAFRKKT